MSQQSGANGGSTSKPPYLSYKTVRNFLDSLKASSVPLRIDRGMLPASMSGTNQVYLIAALRFFRLISEGGNPQDILHMLVTLEGAERAKYWRDIFNAAYAPVIRDVDIERATTRMIEEKFRDAGLSGDSVRKAITFLLHAAKDADIKPSPHIKAQVARNTGQRGRRSVNRTDETPPAENGAGQRSSEGQPPPPPPPPSNMSPYQVLIEVLSPDMEEEEQQAVWTLIRYLKKKEASNKATG